MDNDENKAPTDLEWEQRTLCRDESCIGIIGPDGRCKECGLFYEGSFDSTQMKIDGRDFEATDPEEEIDGEPEGYEEPDAEGSSDLEWEQRTLCSDESCIGVVGPDGRCKECGKPYERRSEG